MISAPLNSPRFRISLGQDKSTFSLATNELPPRHVDRVPILTACTVPHLLSRRPRQSLCACALRSIKKPASIVEFKFYMELRDDDNVDCAVVGNSLEVENNSAGDENETGGSSGEGAFQPGQIVKMDEDSAERDIIPVAVPTMSMGPEDEPYVGQEFESEAAAHAFYNAYATRVGFVIRVSKLSRSRRDGSAIGRALVCNKEGYRMPDKREKIVRQRAETRVGCRAMILVRKVSSGKWVVTKFEKEHAHDLTPGKGRKDCIYDQYPNEHDKIRELSQQLAIEKKRAATYKRHLEMLFEQIDEHNDSLSKKIKHIVDNVKEMETKEQPGHR